MVIMQIKQKSSSHKKVTQKADFNFFFLFTRNSIKPIKCQCSPLIETNQLICIANQLTSFYIRPTLKFNGLILL